MADDPTPATDVPPAAAELVEAARELVAAARRVVVLTGAGISTGAGIPDFRGPEGLWTRNPGAERASTIHTYVADEEARKASWRMHLDERLVGARPTPGHHALVDLERQRRLLHLATQNIDGLHQLAGTSAGLLTEVHGSIAGVACLECGERGPVEPVRERLRAGEEDPRCRTCGGILKTTVVMFGELLPPGAMERCRDAVLAGDLFLAVGTTLEVSPVNEMASMAHERGLPIVIVNAGDTAADHLAAVKVEGSISHALPLIVDFREC